MQKTKASQQTGASSIRPISTTSKYQKVETLNQIVQQINQPKRQTITTETDLDSGSLPEPRNAMGEQVLRAIKQKIKKNYDQLYSNYGENRTKIYKQIQNVETNLTGENAMNSKRQEVIKEKSKYDRAKTNVEEKQRRLNKLLDLRSQLKQTGQNDSSELNKEHKQKQQQFQSKKEEIDHNNVIYNEMLKQRKDIKLTLQKRYKQMSEYLDRTKERTKKHQLQNKKKKEVIAKLNRQLTKEETVEIPESLAEELSNKIEEYENKYSYRNIIHHEAIREEERFNSAKTEVSQRKEEQRIHKLRKDKEEKVELEKLHHVNALNNMQQEKIKRLYGVQSIEEVINYDQCQEKQQLERLSEEIQQEIARFQMKNQELHKQITCIISCEEGEDQSDVSLEELQKKLEQEDNRKKLLHFEVKKKQDLGNHWQTIMSIVNGNQLSEEALEQFTKEAMNRQLKEVATSEGQTGSKMPQSSCRSSEVASLDFQ